MKNVILEYASAAMAVFGAIWFFIMLEEVFLGNEGVIAIIIGRVLGGL